jgi:hypothetical protein
MVRFQTNGHGVCLFDWLIQDGASVAFSATNGLLEKHLCSIISIISIIATATATEVWTDRRAFVPKLWQSLKVSCVVFALAQLQHSLLYSVTGCHYLAVATPSSSVTSSEIPNTNIISHVTSFCCRLICFYVPVTNSMELNSIRVVTNCVATQ